MPQLPESARPTRLAAVTPALVDQKLRIMGHMLAYDAHTALLLLYDAGHALLVDAALCAGWRFERMGAAQVLGYLERAAPELQIPDLPAHAPAPAVDAGLVLRALLVRPAAGAEVMLWNEVLAELELDADAGA
ncbi:hypothetical protein HWV62_22978 [Athelia sp. TMB]|nr:hypothetical protein HWV62_22978 [Athelia sp. TMB]